MWIRPRTKVSLGLLYVHLKSHRYMLPVGVLSKKRKLETTTKVALPVKKAAVGAISAAKPTATVVKKVVQAPKDTKADLSFFTTKPKEKLPAFKRMVPKADPEPAGPTVNAFEEAMKLMGSKSSNGSAAQPSARATDAARELTPTTTVTSSIGKNGKAKKRVTFPPPERLVQIKLIERAIYDDDANGEVCELGKPKRKSELNNEPLQTAQHSSYRDLDIDEGHALHALLFEEQIDWYEPPGESSGLRPARPMPLFIRAAAEYEVPEEFGVSRGVESTERSTQTERENSVLEAVYMSVEHVPDTPTELYQGMEGQSDDSNTIQMSAGDIVSSLEEIQLPTASLQSLLAKIASTSVSGVQQPQGDGGQWAGNSNEDISWGAGHSDDRQGQGGWLEQDDADRGGRTGAQQRPLRGSFPPGTRFNAKCKFYHMPNGRVPFLRG